MVWYTDPAYRLPRQSRPDLDEAVFFEGDRKCLKPLTTCSKPLRPWYTSFSASRLGRTRTTDPQATSGLQRGPSTWRPLLCTGPLRQRGLFGPTGQPETSLGTADCGRHAGCVTVGVPDEIGTSCIRRIALLRVRLVLDRRDALSRDGPPWPVVGRRARRPRGLIDVLVFESYRCYRSRHIENPKEHM